MVQWWWWSVTWNWFSLMIRRNWFESHWSTLSCSIRPCAHRQWTFVKWRKQWTSWTKSVNERERERERLGGREKDTRMSIQQKQRLMRWIGNVSIGCKNICCFWDTSFGWLSVCCALLRLLRCLISFDFNDREFQNYWPFVCIRPHHRRRVEQHDKEILHSACERRERAKEMVSQTASECEIKANVNKTKPKSKFKHMQLLNMENRVVYFGS